MERNIPGIWDDLVWSWITIINNGVDILLLDYDVRFTGSGEPHKDGRQWLRYAYDYIIFCRRKYDHMVWYRP